MASEPFNGSENEEPPVLIDFRSKNAGSYLQFLPTEYREPAVQKLVQDLKNPHMRIRCRAARELREAGDPATAQALVDALEDDEIEVRWLASEALANLGAAAVIPLLEALIARFDSNRTRDGARHILHALQQRGELSAPLIPVYRSLGGVASVVQTPWAAKQALETLGAYPSTVHKSSGAAGDNNPAASSARPIKSIFARR